MMTSDTQIVKKAPLQRQLFAMFYDSWLVVATLALATAILLPFSESDQVDNPFYHVYLLIILFNFYAWFWQKNGQTLGMQVWKIKIIHSSGQLPNWSLSYLRLSFSFLLFLLALLCYWLTDIISLSVLCFFIGHVMQLVFGYTAQDKLSHTMIIDLRAPKTSP